MYSIKATVVHLILWFHCSGEHLEREMKNVCEYYVKLNISL